MSCFNDDCAAGLFWLQAGQTNTVYGVQQSNGQLFFMMLYVAVRVSQRFCDIFALGCIDPDVFISFLGKSWNKKSYP